MVRVFQQLAVCVFASCFCWSACEHHSARGAALLVTVPAAQTDKNNESVHVVAVRERESATLLTLGCAGKALLSVTF
jgi:hypothetical protein